MNVEEYVVSAYGKCEGTAWVWCDEHDSARFKGKPYCVRTLSRIDYTKQVSDAVLDDLMATVTAMKPYEDGRVSKGLVQHFIEEARNG